MSCSPGCVCSIFAITPLCDGTLRYTCIFRYGTTFGSRERPIVASFSLHESLVAAACSDVLGGSTAR
jgi:hypothetical protein